MPRKKSVKSKKKSKTSKKTTKKTKKIITPKKTVTKTEIKTVSKPPKPIPVKKHIIPKTLIPSSHRVMHPSNREVEIKMQPILTQNFIALQKVIITLATKIEGLTNKVDRLLDVFEESAKTLSKQDLELQAKVAKTTAPAMPPKPIAPAPEVPKLPPTPAKPGVSAETPKPPQFPPMNQPKIPPANQPNQSYQKSASSS